MKVLIGIALALFIANAVVFVMANPTGLNMVITLGIVAMVVALFLRFMV